MWPFRGEETLHVIPLIPHHTTLELDISKLVCASDMETLQDGAEDAGDEVAASGSNHSSEPCLVIKRKFCAEC